MTAKKERSLKYETTRPVSAIVNKTTSTASNSRNNRPPSGKKTNQSHMTIVKRSGFNNNNSSHYHPHNHQPVYITEEHQRDHYEMTDGEMQQVNYSARSPSPDGEEGWQQVEQIIYDDGAFAQLGIDLREVDREVNQARGIRVDIDKPRCVIEYEEDVRNMHDMENKIKRTTIELQKKLGINKNAIVY